MPEKINILISNDDGVLAPGLAALHQAVAGLGELTVVAPDSPQSAAGHAITLVQPLTVQRVQIGGSSGFQAVSVDGRPADCVRLAIRQIMPQPPGLVLSGINEGNNVGINVFYSGTVAAAAEAAMLGYPAVAFSACTSRGNVDFARIAELCRWVLDRLLELGLTRGDLINVNIPCLEKGNPIGVLFVRQSTAEIEDIYHRVQDSGLREMYRLGDSYKFVHQDETDVAAIAEGYITITPLHIDMTNHDRLAAIKTSSWPTIPA